MSKHALILNTILLIQTTYAAAQSSTSTGTLSCDSHHFVTRQDAPLAEPPRAYFGPGAGTWGETSAWDRPDLIHLAKAAQLALRTGYFERRYGPLTTLAFKHYFDNNGDTLFINMNFLLKQHPKFKELYLNALKCLDLKIQNQAEGRYYFSMEKMARSRFTKDEHLDLYLGIADFAYWIRGQVTITRSQETKTLVRDYGVELGLYDEYDWDPGAAIPIEVLGQTLYIEQEFVGAFHRAGLAREFQVFSRGRTHWRSQTTLTLVDSI